MTKPRNLNFNVKCGGKEGRAQHLYSVVEKSLAWPQSVHAIGTFSSGSPRRCCKHLPSIYIDAAEAKLVSVGLAQARPNYIFECACAAYETSTKDCSP